MTTHELFLKTTKRTGKEFGPGHHIAGLIVLVVVATLGSLQFIHPGSSAAFAWFGAAKAVTNLAAGDLAERVGRKRLLVIGWLVAVPVPLLIGLSGIAVSSGSACKSGICTLRPSSSARPLTLPRFGSTGMDLTRSINSAGKPYDSER
jgi:MFS family permease